MLRGAANPALKLILGLGLCTVGGAMLYIYFKNRDDEEDDLEKKIRKPRSTSGTAAAPIQKEVKIQMTIGNEYIPLVVGRAGANLARIEERSKTTIRFRDKDDISKLCEIRGFPLAVKEAKQMILKDIERSPIVKEEIFVPQSVCGKIIGRCGEAMQEICRQSMAKVSVDSGGRNGGINKRRIVITGNRSQVNIARKLIEDKIQEDEDLKKSLEEVELTREPRRSPTNSMSSSIYSSQTSLNSQLLSPREKLCTSEYEKPLEVYVSAIASPGKFWVQLIGPQSKKLDNLVKELTDYYNVAENREMHTITEPYLGQIVAAVFKYDGKWYRAEIVGILPNEYNANEVVLDLYFVDYGDSEYCSPHEVFELRTDFLTLRFQAIECFLANIKSTLPNDPETWEQQSIIRFEELTQVANWKKLISKVVTYKDRPKPGNRSKREGSPVPGVELFDLSDGHEVSINNLLISNGLALPENGNEVLRLGGGDSPMSSPRTISYESIPTHNEDFPGKNAAYTNGNNSQLVNNLHDKNKSINPKQQQLQQVEGDYFNGNYSVDSDLNSNGKSRFNNSNGQWKNVLS
ncbi:tudor and KH domain-containing protein homolog [Eupeodes corollae]|uniref:tudor and KH domain-containing protein homolog n=1 Tax=Eupeodes corollae TaxID=290404 RepID=UPI00249234C6|nr:tudor and KH domain-containing protein homolog [Eupeodes corollae]XP_055916780.1 tudor and KH domain-containing protein homolog [Eupeodes corollae]